jgi:DNA-binding LacI/PurR family transcriptional regulator
MMNRTLVRPRRVTSVDVARAASVSQATVTRVYTTPDLVADATAERVRQTAARLGYVPNAMASTLKSGQSNLVGVLVPSVGSYYRHIVGGMSRQLSGVGKQLMLMTFHDEEDIDLTLETVLRYELDGLVLASSAFGAERLAELQSQGRTVVAYNQPEAAGIVPTVAVDNQAGMAELARFVVARGHRDVLFVGGVRRYRTDQLRFSGVADVLAEHGLAAPYLEAGAFTYAAGEVAAGRILERGRLPDAIMVSSDEIAFGLMDGLRERGVRIPEDVSITGHDALPQASWGSYRLTTVEQPAERMVECAVEMVTGAVPADPMSPRGRATQRPEPEFRLIRGTLRVGSTVADLTGSATVTGDAAPSDILSDPEAWRDE